MKTTIACPLLLFVAALFPTTINAATLKVGDPAPPLAVSKWVQGEPVTALTTGQVYIVEFWATWCGPCRATIPHLNKLHNQFKERGLIVIGQNVFERDISLVPTFVDQMGQTMTYRIALDDKEGEPQGKMAKTWMAAADQRGIPASFVVDKQSRIAWIGHPARLTEAFLESVLNGTFDVEKAAAAEAVREQNRTELASAENRFAKSMADKKWAEAELAVADLEKLVPETDRAEVELLRFRLELSRGNEDAAAKMTEQFLGSSPDKPGTQNDLAWTIATMEKPGKNALELARRLATEASESAGGKNPTFLASLARIEFMDGNKNKALGLQQRAIDYSPAKAKAPLRNVLATYRAGKLPPTVVQRATASVAE